MEELNKPKGTAMRTDHIPLSFSHSEADEAGRREAGHCAR
jgi:hypothetical protein